VLNNALWLFMAARILSVLFSLDPGLSWRGFLGKELKFVFLYFLVVEVVRTRKQLQFIVLAVLASALLMVADAGVQYVTGVDFLKKNVFMPLTASFGTANGFAAWILIVLPFLTGMIGEYKTLRRGLRFLLIVLIGLLALCLLGTYSRGGWIGFLVAGGLMGCFVMQRSSLKMRRLYLAAGACLLMAFLFFPQKITRVFDHLGKISFNYEQDIGRRIGSVFNVREISRAHRPRLWKVALKIAGDHPLTGSGLNTYSVIAPRYESRDGDGIYAHNSYLQMLAETGCLGLGTFLFVLYVLFKTVWPYADLRKNPLISWLLFGFLAFLVHAIFDNHFYALQLVVLFWFVVGLMVALMGFYNSEDQILA
jgi:putative inorganic carbon (HCO3(-)) transporter